MKKGRIAVFVLSPHEYIPARSKRKGPFPSDKHARTKLPLLPSALTQSRRNQDGRAWLPYTQHTACHLPLAFYILPVVWQHWQHWQHTTTGLTMSVLNTPLVIIHHTLYLFYAQVSYLPADVWARSVHDAVGKVQCCKLHLAALAVNHEEPPCKRARLHATTHRTQSP